MKAKTQPRRRAAATRQTQPRPASPSVIPLNLTGQTNAERVREITERLEQGAAESYLKPAIHMHGLCILGNVPIERAAPSGHELTDNHGRPIYNMPTWKYGFSTAVPLDKQYERTVNYVTKYITKSDCKIFGKWYLSSRGLKKSPDIIPLEPIQYDQFRDDEKLKMHIQNEHQLYPNGPYMLTEEMPPLQNNS